MERSESKIFREAFAFALVYAVKDLDVAGVSQKGPFVKGSAVTVQGIDCKTMELTHEIFEGTVKSDKGDFGVDDVNLTASCALFEVTGHYFNEVTGKKSAGEVTLHALSDLSDRKHVNINMLTELEYRRVMHLVSEEHMDFADAKKQAEKEVLAAFGIKGDFDNFEDLTIFEGGDGNAALLAVSVMMQAETDEAGLAKRIDKFADSFAETGKWKDDETKAAIESWQIDAAADGTLDSIRKNVESLIYAFADLGAVARDAELLIIGGGDKRYEQFLRNEVSRLSLDNVRFAGFLNGEEKDKALASCSILVMPSEFENFGNVVLEGLIRRIPCIATTGAPWSDLNTHKCGWQVPYSQQDITAAIQTAINTSRDELVQMGERGYELARSKYSIEAVAHSLKNVYEWVLGAECPENVYLL